jgi:membrane associated rhomboid family serine protease
MRDNYPREKTSILIWLISAIAAASLLQFGIHHLWPGQTSPFEALKLTVDGIRSRHIWILLTSSFLHDPEFLFHAGVNLLGLYFIGRELLPVVGSRRFLGLYLGAILTGALAWLAVHWSMGGSYFGATAGVGALLVVFACFYPHRRLDFLLFFLFPISFKPKHVVIGLVFVELGLLFLEIRGQPLPRDLAIASSAHLGGMFAGWCYFRYFHDISWHLPAPNEETELPRWMKRNVKNPPAVVTAPVDTTNPSVVRAEVDRILDKINSDGFNALTADEKRLLDDAKALLSRR